MSASLSIVLTIVRPHRHEHPPAMFMWSDGPATHVPLGPLARLHDYCHTLVLFNLMSDALLKPPAGSNTVEDARW